jgi:hypothetical protein
MNGRTRNDHSRRDELNRKRNGQGKTKDAIAAQRTRKLGMHCKVQGIIKAEERPDGEEMNRCIPIEVSHKRRNDSTVDRR